MKSLLSILLLSLLTLTSCSKEPKKTDGHDHSAMQKTEKKVASKKSNSPLLSNILDNYLAVKNALVSDDKNLAAKSAKKMLIAFEIFPMEALNAEQHKSFIEIAENSKEQLEHIVKSPIDHQREHFLSLSSDTNDLIALIGTDRTLYKEFCPMYKKEGGMWLSASNKIRNPYFGKSMLKCGKVLEEI